MMGEHQGEDGRPSAFPSRQESQLLKARNLVLASLVVLGVVALPATAAHALLVKVSINFGPTVTGPDDGTLIVTAIPGDLLIITWALGTDSSIGRYDEVISGVDTTEITRFGASALELTGQGFDGCCNPNAAFPWRVWLFRSLGRGSHWLRRERW
jgi:hypothetical protein